MGLHERAYLIAKLLLYFLTPKSQWQNLVVQQIIFNFAACSMITFNKKRTS